MKKTIVLNAKKMEYVDADWGGLTWFANRKLGNSEEMTIGKCVIKTGKSNPKHTHPNCSEVLVVMKGKIEHMIGKDESALMQEGDAISIPAGVSHYAVNTGNEEAVLYIAFSSADRQTKGE